MADTKRYGLKIQDLGNSQDTGSSDPTFAESACIYIGQQRSDFSNLGILFQGVQSDSNNANLHNAISWGTVENLSTLRSLYIKKDGEVYKNIGGVETQLATIGGAGVTSLDSLTGDLNIAPVIGITVTDNDPDIELRTTSYNIVNQIATVTIANSNTEATLIGTGIGYNGGGSGDLALPANFFQPGSTLRVTARGIFGTKAVGGGTLNIKIKLGSTLIISTGTQTPLGGLTNQYWEVVSDITCYTDGAGGTVMGNGAFSFTDGGASAYMNVFKMTNTAVVSLDTTASQTFDLRALWATADTANTISLQTLVVEKLQPA